MAPTLQVGLAQGPNGQGGSPATRGESFSMRTLRRTVALLAVLCLLHAEPAFAAFQRENPYWASESTLPAETVTGTWTPDGNIAELTFSGVNAPGQVMTFEAGWMTPWSRRSFSEAGQIDLLLSPDTSVTLKRMTRFQFPGEKWSGWFTHRLPYEEGLGMGGSGTWAHHKDSPAPWVVAPRRFATNGG